LATLDLAERKRCVAAWDEDEDQHVITAPKRPLGLASGQPMVGRRDPVHQHHRGDKNGQTQVAQRVALSVNLVGQHRHRDQRQQTAQHMARGIGALLAQGLAGRWMIVQQRHPVRHNSAAAFGFRP